MRNNTVKRKGNLELEGSIRFGGPSGTLLSGSSVSAGTSGAEGTVEVFPPTAARGSVTYTANDNTGNFTVDVHNASTAGARKIVYPDAGHSQGVPFKLDSLRAKYRLEWTAGQRGKPGIQEDMQSEEVAALLLADPDPDFAIIGIEAKSECTSFYAEGGITMTTAGAEGNEVILVPHADANQSAWAQVTWGTDRETRWECRIKTGAEVIGGLIWAGLKQDVTPTVFLNDFDQAFFRYQDIANEGRWQAVSSINSNLIAREADTDVLVEPATDYHFVIDIDADRIAWFYLNGALVDTTEPLTPGVNFIPFIGVKSSGVDDVRTLHVRGQAIERAFA